MLSRRHFLGAGLAAATPALADPLGQRPGIQLYTVKDALAADAPGTLKQLAAIGYRTVECFDLGKYSPQDFRRLLNANGLACASCHLGFKDGDNGALFDIAHKLGARYVASAGLFGAVGANPATANAFAFHAMASLAGRIGVAAKKAGLAFALHNHNMEFRPINGAPGYDLLLHETDPALVGFEMDCGWVAVAGHDPAMYLKAHPGRFPLLHIKDFSARPRPAPPPAARPAPCWAKASSTTVPFSPPATACGTISWSRSRHTGTSPPWRPPARTTPGCTRFRGCHSPGAGTMLAG